MVSLALLLASPAFTCTPPSMDAAATRALAAYERLDEDGLRAEAEALRSEVECLSAPPTPAQAARVHLVVAIDAWLQGDREAAVAAFRGALAAEPGFALDPALVPSGNELHELVARARQDGPGALTDLAPGLTVSVDGHPGQDAVPIERSALVQAPAGSWYVDRGHLPAGLQAFLPPPERSHAARNFFVAGGVAAILSSAGLLVARDARADFDALGAPTDERADDAAKLWRRNRIAGIGGYAMGAVAGGLFVGAAITAEW